MSKRLLLASSSIYRKYLLDRLQIEFSIATPAIDETAHDDEPPDKLAERLSIEKAQALKEDYPEHFIIGSDQVCAVDAKVINKPLTISEAKQQLLNQSGKIVDFYTGVCLHNPITQQCSVELDHTQVRFKRLSPAAIDHYMARESVLGCAGAFKAEGLGITLVEAIISQDPNAIIGLPLIRLCTLLDNAGLPVVSDTVS